MSRFSPSYERSPLWLYNDIEQRAKLSESSLQRFEDDQFDSLVQNLYRPNSWLYSWYPVQYTLGLLKTAAASASPSPSPTPSPLAAPGHPTGNNGGEHWAAPELEKYTKDAFAALQKTITSAEHHVKGSASASSPPKSAPIGRYTIADAIDKANPAVVNITAVVEERLFGTYGGPRFAGPMSSGSGFIIHHDGTILTNAHVVVSAKRSGNPVNVTLQDGRSFNGTVAAIDTTSDIAVVKVDAEAESLPSVPLGDSHRIRAGEWVIALGSPLTLRNSSSLGIISATEREGYEIGMVGGASAFIQTDAAITQGNSGGPLVNVDGEVIGINTMKAAAADGISFAVPINYVKEVVEQLIKHGKVRRPFLGCKLLTLHNVLAKELQRGSWNFPKNIDWTEKNADEMGVLVHEILLDSPVARGGLKPGDIIVRVDQRKITNVSQFLAELGHKVEQDVEVEVIRGKNGDHVKLKIHPEVRNN